MNNIYPHELSISDVYFSPFIAVFLLSFFAALISAYILNKLRISSYFFYSKYVFLAIMVLYAVLIDKFFIRF
jgi:hypothetical protein